MSPLISPRARLIYSIVVSLSLTFGLSAQNDPLRMLGPVKSFGEEPAEDFWFRGNDILKVDYENSQALYDIHTGETIVRSYEHSAKGLDYNPSTGEIYHPNKDKKIVVSTWQDGNLTEVRSTELFASILFRFSRDGKRILRGSPSFSLYDLETEESIWTFNTDGSILNDPRWNEIDGVIEISETAFPARGNLITAETGEEKFSDIFQPGFLPGKVDGGRYSVYSAWTGESILIDHSNFEVKLFTHPQNLQIGLLKVLEDKMAVLGIAERNLFQPIFPQFFIKSLVDDAEITWLNIARQTEGFADTITAFDLSEDESLLIIGTESGRVESWNFGTQQFNAVLENTGTKIVELKLFNQEKRIAIVTRNERIHLVNLENGESYSTLRGSKLKLSEDGSKIAFRATAGNVAVVESLSGEILDSYPNNELVVISVRYPNNNEYEVLYRDGSRVRIDAASNEESSRQNFDWPFFRVAGKYDNDSFIIGIGEQTYVTNLETGNIQTSLDFSVFESISNNYNKVSADGKILMGRVINVNGLDSVQFVDTDDQSVLVKANGSTSDLSTDLSLDGKFAFVYFRNPDEENTIEISVGDNNQTLNPDTSARGSSTLIDLRTGTFTQNPNTTFPRNLRDPEFSSDGNIIYYQESNGLHTMNLQTWEVQDVRLTQGNRVSRPLNLVRPDGTNDWLIFRDQFSKSIVNGSTGEFVGTINERLAQVAVSANGEQALSVYNGVATLYEFREATFVQGRIDFNPTTSNSLYMVFPSAEDHFYRIQTSWDLNQWDTLENTLTGTGEAIVQFLTSAGGWNKYFARVLEFPPSSSEN